MAAHIQSSIPTKPTLQNVSRDDLRESDVVTLQSVDVHTTYSWTITFAPKDIDGNPSTAVLTAPAAQTTQFTVDHEGPYIIRLVVDAGLPTESTQFVRLRYLTKFADLKLVGAGERRDQTAVVPVDASAEGWANDQNFNLQTLQDVIARTSVSGRVFYVDANRGLDNTNPQNDPTIAESYGDYSSISAAILDAVNTIPAPTRDNPFVIKIQPGLYVEDLTFAPHVHLSGLSVGGHETTDRTVLIRTVAKHEANFVNVGDFCILSGLEFETNFSTVDPCIYKTGLGTLLMDRCTVLVSGASAGQGGAVYQDKGSFIGRDCLFLNETSQQTRVSFHQEADAVDACDSYFERCSFVGPCGVELNTGNLPNATARFVNCFIESTLNHGSSFGLQSSIDSLVLERTEVKCNGIVNALDIHPLGDVHGSSIEVLLLWCNIGGNINFDTTGVALNTRLDMGSVVYNTVNITGSLTARTAVIKGDTLYYDNSVSGLLAQNVQDAIDEMVPALGLTLDIAYDGPGGSGSGRTIIADSGAVVVQASALPPVIPEPGQTDGWLQVEGNIQAGGINSPEINIQPNPDTAGPSIVMGQNVYPDIDTTPHRSIPSATVRANATGSPLHHNYNLRLETTSTLSTANGKVGCVLVKAGEAISSSAVLVTYPDAGDVHVQSGHAKYHAIQRPGSIYMAPGYNALTPDIGYVYFANPAAGTQSYLRAAGAFVGGVAGTITFYVGGVGPQTATIGAGDNLATVCGKFNDLKGVTCAVLSPIRIYTDATGPNAEILYAFDDQSGALNTALGDFSLSGGAVFSQGSYNQTVGVGCSAANTFTIYGNLTVTGTYPGGGALHAATHLFGAADEVDGDRLDIDYTPVNYVRDVTPPEVSNVQELTAHLAGIDNALGSIGVPAHAATHIRGASDEIDGDLIDIDYVPSNYTRTVTAPATHVEHLTAHLAGVDLGLHTLYRVTTNAVLYAPTQVDHYIGVDTSLNIVTVNLPALAPGVWSGREIIVKDEGGLASVNAITIQVGGGIGLIDGAAALSLTSNFSSVTMVCNGVAGPGCVWYVI